jgi:hypothetical protein
VLEDLTKLPFIPGGLISGTLWIVSIGTQGTGMIVNSPLSSDHRRAMVVLRRPKPAAISEPTSDISRLVRAACDRPSTMPCRFYVVEPERIWEVIRDESPVG